ncbi:type I restriction enzyme endonuclease domain-containing protein [Actinomyces minihominis]|uniref:type I restriction enzyme endonuclease domain-containing protein n=1 Tax=Actinomyces minihominis TaxID=2002838 RepID=UPI0013ED25DE|nr:DUF3387 domain-containing protein [Actinomyces minihominis]
MSKKRELSRVGVDTDAKRRAAMQPFIGVPGKALVVCATREIAANLYEEITALRPEWHSDDDKSGKIKVVYTASPADTATIKKHMRRPSANEEIKKRLRDEDDELEIVLVKDMLLTGFDSKPLHTLYLDRPLKGALLMQTLARVNRTFRGKEDGLLVAYAPVAENLGEAMREWTTQTGGQDGTPGTTAEEAAAAALETLDALDKIVGVDWKPLWYSKDRRYDAVKLITSRLRDPATEDNSVEGDGYRRPVADRFRALAKGLARNYAIAGSPPPEGQAAQQRPRLEERRADVQFYEEVRVWLAKLDAQDRLARGEPVPDDVKRLLGEIVVASTESEGVIDIYAKAGLARPQLESLTPEWVEDASQPTKAQMAIDALRALLLSEMSATARHNTVRREQFSSQVNELMIRYTNQQLTAAQVIAALVEMAGDVRAEAGRGQTFDPPLGIDELAFYDLIAQNQSAVDVMGSDVLAQIARELVETMRRDVRTDWTVRADVKAKLRRNIKRLLRKCKYPPDQQGDAVREVVAQMEAMAPRLASEGP